MKPVATRPPALGLMVLLCLDTLETSEGERLRAPQPWARNAARLLEHARRRSWMVAHVLRRPPAWPGRWVAGLGLAPRPDERVFHRDQPSAFSSAQFADLAPANAELVIVGQSKEAAVLKTAVDGLARGFAIAVGDDALAAPPGERARLAELMALESHAGAPRFTLQNTAGLRAARPPLRLLQGGRSDGIEARGQGGVRDV